MLDAVKEYPSEVVKGRKEDPKVDAWCRQQWGANPTPLAILVSAVRASNSKMSFASQWFKSMLL